MATEPPENENTYVLDSESAVEMARLMDQDRLLTRGMGGLLPGEFDLSDVHDILDIACGPGGWALEVAHACPEMQVVGVDISNLVIQYARAQAKVQWLDNVNFSTMNVLRPLEFPDHSFDMVNARFLFGFMLPKDWPKLLQECIRITRPRGIIRLTECEVPVTNSPAFETLNSMFTRALYLAGQSFSPDGGHIGITPMLGRLLQDAGYGHIRERAHVLHASTGMEAYQSFYHNFEVAYKLALPFFIKMKVTTPEAFDEVYQRALEEMMSERFCAVWLYLSVSGELP